MPGRSIAIATAIKGTAIALLTWLVLYLTKENLGRTAALIAAAVLLVIFLLVLFARRRLRAGGGPSRSSD